MFFFKKPKSLNYEERPKGVEPNILLMHYTGMESMEAARERLSDPESKVSAHYLVDEDGRVFDLVHHKKRAWHAGVSFWRGETDINSYSIGIEIVNPGHEFGYRPFPKEQMQAVLKLSREMMDVYDIDHVLAHSDVAPERKQDPGELFDWQWLAQNGVGYWPEPDEQDLERAVVLSRNDFEVEKLFLSFGYNPASAFVDIVTAFHRHYYPEIFRDDTHGAQGMVCEQTVARILSLKKQMTAKPI